MIAEQTTKAQFPRLEGITEGVLTPEAIAFIRALHEQFEPRRRQLLEERERRAATMARGPLPGFQPETADIRRGDWRVAPIPKPLQKRNVEITGPVDQKMIINALNSGADVFMADFEDANSPTWENVMAGQQNLFNAIRRQIDFTLNGKKYALNDSVATLFVRPRGWHLEEQHFTLDGETVSGSLLDFGLYAFHNAHYLLKLGLGPYFYLPKLEHYTEARLWNDVMDFTEQYLSLPQSTIRCTVLIETILASLQMDEILYELRDHIVALNAGRWDYIFSVIKKFGKQELFILPDRSQVTMQVPFMSAYATLLVQTCHKRGAHAIGGMAAFIPSRKDAEVNRVAMEKVTQDKTWEAALGFDGTWVAHPDLVPIARNAFDEVLQGRPHQKNVMPEKPIKAKDLLDVAIPNGRITCKGLAANIDIGIRYIASWLNGVGAAAIHNLMEDAATAEISRAQVWQWIYHECHLDDRTPITRALVAYKIQKATDTLKAELGEETYQTMRFDEAKTLFEKLVYTDKFETFLTLPAYQLIK